MVSICRKLSRGRDQKKKVPALAQLFQPPTNCNPLIGRLLLLLLLLLLLQLLLLQQWKMRLLRWVN